MAAATTSVTIDGARTELLFGARYRVRYGRDAKILRDAELVDRKANGDLVFREVVQHAGDSVMLDDVPDEILARANVRVRPSTIDAIFGSGTEALDYADQRIGGFDAPDLATELAAQAEVDSLVESFVSDGDRDPDSVAEKVETELLRRADSIVSPRRDDETAAAYLARLELPVPKGLGAAYTRWIETDPGQRALEDARRESDQARKVVPFRKTSPKALAPLALDADGKVVVSDPKPRAGAKPYSERNQVWKCGTCKRRTRQPECANGHAPVSAPAGKRAAERLAK